MDRDEQHIIVAVYQFYRFLYLTVDTVFYETSEPAYSMVDMHYVIPLLERIDIVHRQSFATFDRPFETYPAVAVKNLMVSIQAYLPVMIYKTFLDGILHVLKTQIIG